MEQLSQKDKALAVHKEFKAGLGSKIDLCRKHNISMSNYYYHQAKFPKTMLPKKRGPKKYSAPKILDIPLQTKPEFVIICRAEDAAKIMGSL